VDVREGLAGGPVVNVRDLGVVGNAPFVSALVSKDGDVGACNDDLFGGDGGTSGVEAV